MPKQQVLPQMFTCSRVEEKILSHRSTPCSMEYQEIFSQLFGLMLKLIQVQGVHGRDTQLLITVLFWQVWLKESPNSEKLQGYTHPIINGRASSGAHLLAHRYPRYLFGTLTMTMFKLLVISNLLQDGPNHTWSSIKEMSLCVRQMLTRTGAPDLKSSNNITNNQFIALSLSTLGSSSFSFIFISTFSSLFYPLSPSPKPLFNDVLTLFPKSE